MWFTRATRLARQMLYQQFENPLTQMNTTTSQTKGYTNSSTQFAFQAPASRQVSLAGDFNNWDPSAVPMHKGPDGTWRVSVPLKPGRYEYRFYADGVWRDDPAAQQRSPNPLGTENCVKVVAG
jgi:1,4-alpha-glucan branching enzyme